STNGGTSSYEFAANYGAYFSALPTADDSDDPSDGSGSSVDDGQDTDDGSNDTGSDTGDSDTGSGDTGGTDTGSDDNNDSGNSDTGGSTPGETPTTEKRVVAYFPSWGIYQKGYNVADLPADKLTHIIHAFARISNAGEIEIIDTWADLEILTGDDTWDTPIRGNFGAYRQLKEQYPHLRVLIAVGGWFDSGKFSDVAATAAAREKFAQSVRSFVVNYGFDGVDLDWEYPVVATDVNSNVRPADGENYALLAAAIRAEFDAQSAVDGKTYEISAATPAGYDKYEKINLAALGEQLDWYNVMTYDYHGRWAATQTGHNAALFQSAGDPNARYNVNDTITGYLAAGVPANKLVLGVPAYGYGWQGVTNEAAFSSASGVGPGTLSVEPGFYDYRTVADLVAANPANEKWDEAAQASYYYDGNIWIGYDSPRALRRKLDYVAEKNLGGVMFWEASTDVRSNGAANQLISIAADEM
ncbi:MAG: glycosyl hydrolase family 18 protein, partial [Puniceicoccales bacterium]